MSACDSEIHCMHTCPGRKNPSSSLLTAAHRSIPPYHIFHQGHRKRFAVSWILFTYSFPMAHISQSAQERCRTAGIQTQLCSCPMAIPSQGRTDQKAVPLENGTLSKLKCLICSSGVSLDSQWHIPLNPHCTSTKLRGEEMPRVDGYLLHPFFSIA